MLLLGCVTLEPWSVSLEPVEPGFETDDGCTVTWSELGLVAGWPETEELFRVEAVEVDLLAGGSVLSTEVPDDSETLMFRTARYDVLLDGASAVLAGTLSCDRELEFALRGFEDTRYACAGPPSDMSLSVAAESVFDDGTGTRVGQTWIDADGDADGLLDEEELEYARLSQLDYDSEAEHLLEHARWQTGAWVEGCTPAGL